MRHAVGKSLLDGFKVGRATELGLMIRWRVDVAVRVIVGLKSHAALNIFRLNEKQFGPTKVTLVNVVRSRAPVMKLHEMSKMWMVGVLV